VEEEEDHLVSRTIYKFFVLICCLLYSICFLTWTEFVSVVNLWMCVVKCWYVRDESDGERLHSSPRDYAWGPSGLDNIISQLLTQFGDNGPPPAEQEKIDNLPTVHINADNEGTVLCQACVR